MDETEQPGVQGLPRKGRDRGASGAERCHRPAAARAINRVADQRMAGMRQMDADLMGTPGQQAALDQRCVIAETLLDGERVIAARAAARGTTAIFCGIGRAAPILR